jgi:hypothetical protein
MRWLHRLLNDCHQQLTHLLQIHLTTQDCIESGKSVCRIILAPEEAAINTCLDALTQ